MSGRKRFATIFATLTSVVGTGGGATYYALESGHLSQWLGAKDVATLEPTSAATGAQEATSLAAVENAWIEAPEDRGAIETGSMRNAEQARTARSASDTLANESSPNETFSEAAVDNRYGMPDGAHEVEQALDESFAASESTTASEGASVAVPSEPDATDRDKSSGSNRYGAVAGAAAVPGAALASIDSASGGAVAQGASIARGQEPGVEPTVLPIGDEPDPVASGSVDGAQVAKSSSNSSTQRAREAFQESAPSTADRYGSAAAPGAFDENAAQGAQAMNPFSGGAPSEASNAEPTEMAAIHSDAGSVAPKSALGATDPAIAGSLGKTSSEYGPTNARSAAPANATATYGSNQAPYGASGATMSSGDGTGRPGERALEGPQNPSLVFQKLAPAEIQVGKQAKFLIKVQNVGNQTAEDVVVRDEVPQGTRFVGATPTAEINGMQLVWRIGKLSTGEERTIEVELMPITEGEVGSVAAVSYSGQASAKTRCTMPQLAIRMTAPEEVMVGHEQRVKIELHNPGSGDATNVMLFENVPENVRHAAGPALEFEIGTLKAGETRELELVLLAEKAGKVVNVLSARADGNLQVEQQVEFEVIAPAISVTVDGPGRRYLERPATYQVIVENPGTAPARDIELVTKLPKGLQFVKANNMGQYDANTHAVYWSLAELPEGERGTVELTAMPIEPGTQTLQVEGRAQQGLIDEVSQPIEIEGVPSIVFEVRDGVDPIEVGGETSYEIRVVNEGTKAASNVQVTVGLTPGMQVLEAEGETRHSVQGPGVLFEPLAQLAPKADAIFRVKAKGVHPGDQRINVEVKTDDLSQPVRREENTRVFGNE